MFRINTDFIEKEQGFISISVLLISIVRTTPRICGSLMECTNTGHRTSTGSCSLSAGHIFFSVFSLTQAVTPQHWVQCPVHNTLKNPATLHCGERPPINTDPRTRLARHKSLKFSTVICICYIYKPSSWIALSTDLNLLCSLNDLLHVLHLKKGYHWN